MVGVGRSRYGSKGEIALMGRAICLVPGGVGESFFAPPKKVLRATFHTLLSIRYFDWHPGW